MRSIRLPFLVRPNADPRPSDGGCGHLDIDEHRVPDVPMVNLYAGRCDAPVEVGPEQVPTRRRSEMEVVLEGCLAELDVPCGPFVAGVRCCGTTSGPASCPGRAGRSSSCAILIWRPGAVPFSPRTVCRGARQAHES